MQKYIIEDESIYTRIKKFLCGLYTLDNSKLKNEHLNLLIARRKSTSKHKTLHFLLCIDSDDKRYYVSNLYQLNDSCYDFDYGGISYQICLEGNQADIIQKS